MDFPAAPNQLGFASKFYKFGPLIHTAYILGWQNVNPQSTNELPQDIPLTAFLIDFLAEVDNKREQGKPRDYDNRHVWHNVAVHHGTQFEQSEPTSLQNNNDHPSTSPHIVTLLHMSPCCTLSISLYLTPLYTIHLTSHNITLLHITLLHITLLHITLLHITLLHITLLHITLLHITLLTQ